MQFSSFLLKPTKPRILRGFVFLYCNGCAALLVNGVIPAAIYQKWGDHKSHPYVQNSVEMLGYFNKFMQFNISLFNIIHSNTFGFSLFLSASLFLADGHRFSLIKPVFTGYSSSFIVLKAKWYDRLNLKRFSLRTNTIFQNEEYVKPPHTAYYG